MTSKKNNKTNINKKSIIEKLTKKILKRIIKDITVLGGTLFYILTIITLYFTNKKIIALKLTIALIITYIIISFIRILYFKERPKKKEYNNIIEKIDASSFPSMHSTRIIILTLTLTKIYNNIIITMMLILIASLVGISRIILKKHYTIDVIAGYILGILIYYTIFLLSF